LWAALGTSSIAPLTRQQCKAFVSHVDREDIRQKTKIGIVLMLGALLSAAVDDDDCPLTTNPAAGLRGLLHEPNALTRKRLSRDKYFDREEVADVLATAREHVPEWHPFVLCGMRTGLRRGELLGLKWGDIDWRKGFVHVQRAWVRSDWTTPKNGEDRTVDLSQQLRAELRLCRKRQTAAWFKRGLSRPE
jgi:integrase